MIRDMQGAVVGRSGTEGARDASVGFYLREASQSQNNTEKMLYNSRYALMCYRN